MEANDALITILKKSHEEALNGLTISGEEVQTFMNDKVIEYVKDTRQDDNKVLEMMKKDQSE